MNWPPRICRRFPWRENPRIDDFENCPQCADVDSGVATLWAAGGIAAIVAIIVFVFLLSAAEIARHRAESAADLSALAAAGQAPSGEGQACGRAAWVARRMDVRLTTCRLDGWDAQVEVTVPARGPLSAFPAANARARAGPDRS
ncbi:MAG: flp pilus-assembly TadE/G-like family protein [Sciscionella sp.]|nr:flp pilus-assembly TadE/G-like family protein [Sciscionella sp.]